MFPIHLFVAGKNSACDKNSQVPYLVRGCLAGFHAPATRQTPYRMQSRVWYGNVQDTMFTQMRQQVHKSTIGAQIKLDPNTCRVRLCRR